jgi:hypothetical protein
MLKITTYEILDGTGAYISLGLEADNLVIRNYAADGSMTGEVEVLATRGFMAQLTEAVSEIEREVIGE